MERLQHISRLGDVGQVDLGLDFVAFRAAGTRSARRSGLRFGVEVSPHLFRFMVFQGAGMGLLFRDSDLWKYVENGFAFDFQLPGQIVDSNLAHPPFRSSDYPLSLHINLTVLM
jgi:hypothetical protein